MLLDKSWMNKRGDPKYIEGIHMFVNFVKETLPGEEVFTCPCTRCKNSKGHIDLDTINFHLLKHGFDQSYLVWHFHGEVVQDPIRNDISMDDPIDDNDYPMMEDLVNDIFNEQTQWINTDPEKKEGKKYTKYREMATQPLYSGCPKGKTTLSTLIELQNLKTRYGWTGNSVTALLLWVSSLFEGKCNLPVNYPSMKNIIKDLGMECETIHACRNGCILYRKEYEKKVVCPKCGVSRYKFQLNNDIEKKTFVKQEPAKFVKYFPLIPRLKRYFSIPWIGEAMIWHSKAKNNENLMRHPCDSDQWNSVNIQWPHFSADPRNLRLAIATDGFNPYGSLNVNYTCWPVILAPLNLPPSLCMKREFSLLTLLISGSKAPGKHIDVFLEPMLEDLQQLWGNGVSTWDAFTESTFTLRAMLLWGVHDLPAYGTLSGCNVHGYKACPVCGNDVDSERLDNSKKICYRGYRMFLEPDHKFRNDTRFNNSTDHRSAPRRLSGEEVDEQVSQISNTDMDSALTKRPWSRRSILFNLPYWKFLEVRHNIDVMHTEKNVTEHLLNILMNVVNKTSDGLNARKDMKEMGLNKKLWLVEDEESGKSTMPKASYALTKNEKQKLCSTLKDLKLPSGFSSNLSNLVSVIPPQLKGLKSHDYHVIMQQLLPVLLRHTFHKEKELRVSIHRISLFFNILCAKVINKEDLRLAKRALVEAMCVLEKELPPSFFVISVHCMIHLADEALACGPVRFRWMYEIEQLMKDYKGYTLNKRYVEGSIAEAYIVNESVLYCMEYMPKTSIGGHINTRESRLDEGTYLLDSQMPNGGSVVLNSIQHQQVSRWVFKRLAHCSDWERKYKEYSKRLTGHSRRGGSKKATPIIKEFIPWLRDELLEAGQTNIPLWRLANGPLYKATRYKKYCVNGFTFAPSSSNCSVTQDSGVSMKAYAGCVAGGKDKNPKDGMLTFYGTVRDILELDYVDFKEVVFYCDWVKVEDLKIGCKVDPLWNHVMVNLKKLKNKERVEEDPFILAQEATGVFYSKCEKDDDWHVVLHTPRRLSKQVDMLDTPIDYQSILSDNPNLRNLLKFDD